MKEILIKSNEEISTQIIIQGGLTGCLNNYIDDLQNSKKFFLITNTKIAKLYKNLIYKFANDRIFIVKDGEKYKNFKTFEKILNFLLSKKIERSNTIVALGGGVVGDLAGFAASTVLRGVNLIQIPTTLLAMCDSSVGGKTGINSNYGKNLIGTFYNASKVLIDTDFINTLSDYEYKCGLGEAIKYAFIEKSCKNSEYYDLIEYFTRNQKDDVKYDIANTIEKCLKLKANVVMLDRKEGGLRKILNFGHTYAHPIETLSNYRKISHGEAVAYGMRFASKLSKDTGLIDEEYYKKIIFLLDKFELATGKIKYKPDEIIDLMSQDKKVQKNKINLLLPTAPAVVGLFDNINRPSLEASML